MSNFIEETSLSFIPCKWVEKHIPLRGSFIAGGCFKDIFTGVRVKDLDVFSKSTDDQKVLLDHIASKPDTYTPYYNSDKVDAFRHTSGVIVEIVKLVFGEPEEILSQFDFTISKFAYFIEVETDSETGIEKEKFMCLYHYNFFKDLIMHRVVIDDAMPFPVSSFERMLRYAKKGFFPCRGTKEKIIRGIRELSDLPDISLSLYDGLY